MNVWFKDKLAGPLAMLIITSLSAGIWTLVVIALGNQTELKMRTQFMKQSILNDARHDKVDEQLAATMQRLAEVQTEFKIYMSEKNARDFLFRRDLDDLRQKINR